VTITDNGNGSVTIDAAGGGGGGGEYVSTEYNVNHTTAQGNPYVIGDRVWYNGSVYRCIANNDAINPSNPTYWTLVAVGYRLRQSPVDWNASSGDYQILNKPIIPTELRDLTDVNILSPAQNDTLLFDAPTNQFLNGQLGDVAYSNDYNDLSNLPTIPAAQIQSDWTQANTAALDYIKNKPTIGSGTVTSVGLTMPSPTNAAFSVTGSPVTASGTLAVGANGTVDQYIDGTGALRTLPSTGGGGGQVFYFNGNVSQGTIGGNDYYELGITANTGPAANFTRATTGAIARFITDVGSPNHVLIPAGVWTIDVYLSESGGGANHAQITVTLYTEDARIGEVHTTYAIGVSSLNGLTESTQNFAVGTTGTDFAISSAGSTHTFNLPTASAANRGALSSADWSTFNGKQDSIGLTTVGTSLATLANPSAIRYIRINADNTASAISLATLKTELGLLRGVQTSNLTSATTGTNVNITGCQLALDANSSYIGRLVVSSGFVSTTGFNLLFTFPSGSTMNVGQISSAAVGGQFMQWQAVTSGAALTNRLNQANNQTGLATIEIFISTAGTSGNLTPAFVTSANGSTATVYGNATFIQLEKI